MENQFGRIEEVKANWKWFLALGVFLLILGASIITSSFYATLFSIVLLGGFLFAAGIVQIIQAFLAKKWNGLFLSLFVGLLYMVTGFLLLSKPAVSAINLTLWIAAFCFIAGLVKMLTALLIRFKQWEWVFFNGLVTFLLGAMIYADWPLSGLWVIGLFIGVDLILSGWSWILLSLTARSNH